MAATPAITSPSLPSFASKGIDESVVPTHSGSAFRAPGASARRAKASRVDASRGSRRTTGWISRVRREHPDTAFT